MRYARWALNPPSPVNNDKNTLMRIASWNLNNRVGAVPFRPEAADAAMALGADALFFCEYFPREHGASFQARLASRGWSAQLVSPETREVANRVLVASRVPMVPDPYPRPRFDHQFPANVVIVRFPAPGLRVMALRIPSYAPRQRALIAQSWDWLEQAAQAFSGERTVIVGDLNCTAATPRQKYGDHLKRIVDLGWTLATPATGASYFGLNGRTSVIDHLLLSPACVAEDASFVMAAGGFRLAGAPGALSDHAALVATIKPARRMSTHRVDPEDS